MNKVLKSGIVSGEWVNWMLKWWIIDAHLAETSSRPFDLDLDLDSDLDMFSLRKTLLKKRVL